MCAKATHAQRVGISGDGGRGEGDVSGVGKRGEQQIGDEGERKPCTP
jgi:hypothetical protein